MQEEMEKMIEEYFPEDKRASLPSNGEMSLVEVSIVFYFINGLIQ